MEEWCQFKVDLVALTLIEVALELIGMTDVNWSSACVDWSGSNV